MKFNIDRNTLFKALQTINFAIPKNKHCFNIFRCFIFKIDKDILHIIGDDYYGIRLEETVIIDNPKDCNGVFFAVEARRLLRAVKTLESQSLEFEILEYQVIVQHITGSFALPTENTAEFIKRKGNIDFRDANYMKLEAPCLKNILTNSVYAVADDSLRPIMNGVCMNFTNDFTDFVASDGYKLIRIRKHSIKTDKPAKIIIPTKAVNVLRRILQTTGFAEMRFHEFVDYPDEPICQIITDNITLTIKTIPGRYPDYNKVIPTRFGKTFQVNRKTLINSIERLNQFINENNDYIDMTLDKGSLIMESGDMDLSIKASEKLTVEYSGKRVRFRMRNYILEDILRNLISIDVKFEFEDHNHPFVISPTVQPDYEEITALIMPLYLDD